MFIEKQFIKRFNRTTNYFDCATNLYIVSYVIIDSIVNIRGTHFDGNKLLQLFLFEKYSKKTVCMSNSNAQFPMNKYLLSLSARFVNLFRNSHPISVSHSLPKRVTFTFLLSRKIVTKELLLPFSYVAFHSLFEMNPLFVVKFDMNVYSVFKVL